MEDPAGNVVEGGCQAAIRGRRSRGRSISDCRGTGGIEEAKYGLPRERPGSDWPSGDLKRAGMPRLLSQNSLVIVSVSFTNNTYLGCRDV